MNLNNHSLGLQWQWAANPKSTWLSFTNKGELRLFSAKMSDSAKNFWTVPNILSQKFPVEQFTVTTKLHFKPSVIKLEEKNRVSDYGGKLCLFRFKKHT
jgi:cysteinyl-tRNA synthetase